MIRHVVLLTMNDDLSDADVETIVSAIKELPSQIPALMAYEVGADLGLAEGNATIAITADVEDVEGYEAYRDHPAHQAVINDLIRPRLASRSAAQFLLS